MRSSQVQAVAISDIHWAEVQETSTSALRGSQCSCGGQSGSCGGWSAAAQDAEQETADHSE